MTKVPSAPSEGMVCFFKLEETTGSLEPTLPKTNITPENRPSQKETHLPTMHFQV